jgi:hypothetical protein
MEQLTFYIGFHNKNDSYQKEVVIENVEFEDIGKALKLLRALSEIFKYLTKGTPEE